MERGSPGFQTQMKRGLESTPWRSTGQGLVRISQLERGPCLRAGIGKHCGKGPAHGDVCPHPLPNKKLERPFFSPEGFTTQILRNKGPHPSLRVRLRLLEPPASIRSLVEGLRRRNVSDDVLNVTLPTFTPANPHCPIEAELSTHSEEAEPWGKQGAHSKL